MRAGWRERLATHRMETPDAALDVIANDWVRYQAIAARLWGRAGYYQQSGAFGFRDQLQDSQVWLTIDPARCRRQLNLHAEHQFVDGSVYHWWHPLTEQGHVTKMTDDLLWLAFVAASYIRETGDLSVLRDTVPYLDEKTPAPLSDHALRAFRRVFHRTSARGIPLIGAGDWNDGLSAMGLQEKGESFWLGQFLVGLLADWTEIWKRAGRADLSAEFGDRRTALVAAINAHGWDGEWYLRGTLDDGRALGTSRDRVGRIFLNAQTWAILNDVAPPDRAARCLASVKKHLVTEAGALLLAPAFDVPVAEIGYITRYAPGLRENGGVYTHAATWAIAAAAKAKDAELVGRLLDAINPSIKDPDRYFAEPYVLPGNVDGPDSPAPRPRRLDLVHGFGRLAPPRRGRVGARRAAGIRRTAHRSVPAARLGPRADGPAVARRDLGDRDRARRRGGRRGGRGAADGQFDSGSEAGRRPAQGPRDRFVTPVVP